MEGEKVFGMEDDLTQGEKMVADANQKYATMAQKRWEIAESNDPDLIEYGVDQLGDLVKQITLRRTPKKVCSTK